jgi:two component transcriptional regulator, winged helix family
MYKIFLIEDDESLAKLIKSGLERFGYEVFVAEDFFNIIPQYKNIMPHLVLIDVNLPFFNGYHWCSQIRKFSKVPIIFISSVTERMNIIMALNMGDDNYITFNSEIIIYSVVISVFFFLIFIIYDYFQFYKKYKKLKRGLMLEQLNIDNLLDKAYLDYMYKIKAELEEKLKDSTKESAKMRKFYTI